MNHLIRLSLFSKSIISFRIYKQRTKKILFFLNFYFIKMFFPLLFSANYYICVFTSKSGVKKFRIFLLPLLNYLQKYKSLRIRVLLCSSL
jgi:hypothetical protein